MAILPSSFSSPLRMCVTVSHYLRYTLQYEYPSCFRMGAFIARLLWCAPQSTLLTHPPSHFYGPGISWDAPPHTATRRPARWRLSGSGWGTAYIFTIRPALIVTFGGISNWCRCVSVSPAPHPHQRGERLVCGGWCAQLFRLFMMGKPPEGV